MSKISHPQPVMEASTGSSIFSGLGFEEHSENPAPYNILLGLLGTEQLFFRFGNNVIVNTEVMPDPCQRFTEARFYICGRFLEYWQANGGLTQQGLPISWPYYEKNPSPPAGDGQLHLVQYFQRARFELHHENSAPYDVLLGLLGSEQFNLGYTKAPPIVLPVIPGTISIPKVTTPAVSPPGVTTLIITTPATQTTIQPTTVATTAAITPNQVPTSGCLPGAVVSGNLVQACVSNPSPAQNSDVTVYGRLVINNHVISGAQMHTTWRYKTTNSYCSGFTGVDGIASCTRGIGRATSGFTVEIDVIFTYNGQNYTGSTGFTTQ